ncbi:MAG: hypothetical protein E6K78_01500 [Candidatus Eisenbacteria bacterium]|uniref:Calcineurin-like phosphoesterase domain-containing protein n=1 Tax=Eiseniibacteriota bacterium TaxID=2212470 RepID=A0A538TXI5_UNCEI|nr:MAG: hypothetical protein E6K78_01500 [Candidatus Eisenbacteria bacterium]
MRVAALYDVHGSLWALDAVLAEIDRKGGADRVLIEGDVCWGPRQTLERLIARGAGPESRLREALAGVGQARDIRASDFPANDEYVQLLLEPPSGDWAATFFEDMAAKRARPTS